MNEGGSSPPLAVREPMPRSHPLDVIQAFAEAVARPGGNAMLIDADNRGEEWVPIPNAVQSGRAFFVDVRTDILATDADQPELAEATEQLAAELREAAIIPVIVASGRPGNRHLFASVGDPGLRGRFAARARELGLDVRRSIRPPLAPHRLDLQVALIDPPTAEEALEALRPIQTPGLLSARMWRLLRDGDRQGTYRGDRSRVIMALVLAMVNRDWPEEHAYHALIDPRNDGGEKVQEIRELKGEQAARDYVRGRYKKALDRVIDHPPLRNATEARNLIGRIKQRADSHAWPGKAGASAHSTLAALIGIADRAANSAFTASHRQIALASGVSRKTSDKAIVRLIDGGWLRSLWRGRGRWPSAWKLVDHQCEMCSASNPLKPGGREDNGLPGRQPGDDACRWGGLGKNGCRILDLLDPERGVTAKEVAAALKIHISTARKNLAKLAAHQLAIRGQDGLWRRAEHPDLREAARDLGVDGAGERQREQHEREQATNWRNLGFKANPWTGEVLDDWQRPQAYRCRAQTAGRGEVTP